MTKLSGAIVLLLAGALVGAACERVVGIPETPGAIRIEMGDFFFRPASITLKHGEKVTLRLVNTSAVEHDFAIGRRADAAAGRYEEDFFDNVKVASSGRVRVARDGGTLRVFVAPLGTAEITFTVPDVTGSFESACFIAGHYQSGMKGTLLVE